MGKLRKKVGIILLSLTMLLAIYPQSYALASTKSYRASSTSNNNYPIVMVHGLLGWGNTELFGLNYWGGFSSLRDYLTNEGYTVYTPTVGSITSNWDRACELYAYLKGGTVDYGEAHSKKYGHERYGRTYPGVYKSLGEATSDGSINKVHLIGHSMGGQTIRLITQLLEQGSADEIAATPSDNISELFKGGHSWVSSVTTLCTPNDGSPTANKLSEILPNVQQFVASLGAQAGIVDSSNPCFDYRLDQWGLHKEKGESLKDYTQKVNSSNLWNKTKDFSLWDLTPEGSKAFNSWVSAQKDVYYFSLACQDTHEDSSTKYQVPDANMNPLFLSSSKYIGSCINNNEGQVPITKTWWQNDGLVSIISAEGPHVGSSDKIVPFSGVPEKGVWNYLGVRPSTDHIQMVGLYKCDNDLKNQYASIAKMLTDLPK
ncbi:esterase/lipase family protein [Clostridium felsineum]|uniref:esterase/lipase family protein n=1 Tax=Clostridium felsineum TaxID=36839 RepID=UPI00098BF507|nr:lipase [Clostridium felsineum]URZ01707.1 Lipase [Clostridium felsineum]